MRLHCLGLTRFGIFTDRSINFGEPVTGKPDLHIVYGPNESGKSTALAGFLDLLFGFEHRSPYSFVHGYDAMQVEADLHVGGDIRHFVRIRKRQGSLLDESGMPVSDEAIVNALGGMNRETYKAMFSLDDDTLEAGGEEILKSEGDLGQLLFASGAGLVELSRTLNRLRDTVREFHKSKSRSTRLHELKARLDGFEEEKRKLDTAASTYARLLGELSGANAAYDEAMALRAKLQADREREQRRVEGLRRLAEIRPLRAELAELESLPEVPQVWFTQIGKLIVEEPKLAERIEGLRNQERKLNEEREELVLDDEIFEIADRLDQLDMARARYVTAEEDLPRRRSSIAEHQVTIVAIVRRLNVPEGSDPESLIVPSGTVGDLQDLIERRSGIEERQKAAVKGVEVAKASVGKASDEFQQAATRGESGEEAIKRLSSTLDEIQADDFGARFALHTDQSERLRAELDAQVQELHPWNHGAEDLRAVRVPEPEELEDWRSILDDSERDIERIAHEKARLLAGQRCLADLKGRQTAESGVVGDEEATRLRALRDEAWTYHRTTLDLQSAESFEVRMKEDDAATGGRIEHATALAGLRKTAEELKSAAAEIERNEAELSLTRERRQRVLDCMASAVGVMCQTGADQLTPEVSLPKLKGWLERRSTILDTLVQIDRENVEIERACKDEERTRQRLSGALKGIGLSFAPEVELEELVAAARTAVGSDATRRAILSAARQRLAQSQAELEPRNQDANQANVDDVAWRHAWGAALSDCWLGSSDPIPSAPAVRRILDDLTNLKIALDKRNAMIERVRLMESDQSRFTSEVQYFVKSLGEVSDAEHAVALGDGLIRRLAAAKASRTTDENLKTKFHEISEQIAVVQGSLAEHRSVANQLLEAFGVDTLQAVEELLQKVEHRKTIRNDLTQREAHLVDSMKAGSVEAAEQDLRLVDSNELEREIVEIQARLDDITGRTQKLYHKVEVAREGLLAIGGDRVVARLEEERRTCLLEIQEGARDYVRIRLGIEAAESALRTYRDAHRGSMMDRASQAFRTISRGTYSRLEAQWSEKGEVLLGIDADGRAKIASQMSKGARFQLYLALRLAGYREFVDMHGPVPFIADDILETFDDFRAEEAFHLFAKMAEVGQVVYLSHHRHLCGIAQDVCPEAKIHELPAPLGTAAIRK